MPIKTYKPVTPARRYMSVEDFSEISKTKRKKSLTSKLNKKSGRNSHGKITVRHRGGGAKRLYRKVDFKRFNFDQVATVESIEYDPNRTSFIMLVAFEDGSKSYMIAPNGIKEGDTVVSSQGKIEPKDGNRMKLQHIPEGSSIYNIEIVPQSGGKIVRSAGASATLATKDGSYVQIKLPSGEIRLLNENCLATVGQVSNADHTNRVIGKAGRVRHMGKRPTVRGKVMNPVDHPHGGGEARNPIGLTHPKTKWGKPALGVKTRKKKKYSDKFIVRRRSKKRR